jgi:hypothetical protein
MTDPLRPYDVISLIVCSLFFLLSLLGGNLEAILMALSFLCVSAYFYFRPPMS